MRYEFASVINGNGQPEFIETGLIYPDGDTINIYVSDRHPLRASDGGMTARKLYSKGIRLDEAQTPYLSYVCARFNVTIESDGSVARKISGESMGIDCLELCEAIAFLAGLGYHRMATKASPFYVELDSFMENAILPKGKYTREWTDERRDPQGVFPVDYHMNKVGTPRNLFCVPASGPKTELVAAVTSFLRLESEHKAMAVIAPDARLSRTKLDRLKLVVDDICLGIKKNECRIEEFLLSTD